MIPVFFAAGCLDCWMIDGLWGELLCWDQLCWLNQSKERCLWIKRIFHCILLSWGVW